jgi:predicted amidohydrolase
MTDVNSYVEDITIGIIQATVDASIAWQQNANMLKMSPSEDDRAWLEIRSSLRALQNGGERPKFILMPELSLPRTRVPDFGRLVGTLNAIAVVGVDYRTNDLSKAARNEGMVFVPRNFFSDRPSRNCTIIPFGKTDPAPGERRKLENMNPSWRFEGDFNVYVFDADGFGRFGVSICWDFMDIERALMYRWQLQHLFVLAYNRDLEMFRSLARSLSRTIFCNVAVCNTGFYGGSIVVSPYRETYRRTLYAHDGAQLFTTQVVKLPVRDLVRAQQGDMVVEQREQDEPLFKEPPARRAQRRAGLVPVQLRVSR